jgi:hypothetical protein
MEPIKAYAAELRATLNELVENETARDKMTLNDERFDETTQKRNDLVRAIVKLLQK